MKPPRVVTNTTFDLQATLDELERLRESEKNARQAIYQVALILGQVHAQGGPITEALKVLSPFIPKADAFGPWGM
jgi:hypothetical protein